MTTNNLQSITGLSVAVDDEWRTVPMEPGAGDAWADALIVEWGVDGIAAEALREQLARLQHAFADRVGGQVSALVWVPVPASGYCGGGLVAMNWPRGDSGIGSPEDVLQAYGAGAFLEPGDTLLEQRVWTGEFPAGAFAGVHRVTSSPAPQGEETVIETVEYFVFPDGSAEFVHLSFTAESISAFDDMPAQTQAVAQTVQVELGSAR